MRWLRLFLLGLVLTACATSPTGRSQLMMVSDAQMVSAGQQLFAQMQQKTPPVTDAHSNTRVDCVVNALLAELPPEQRRGWETNVFADKQPNAFALPGRKIGVYTGMLDLVQNDAQLAAVIGHEIGHVLARHANERASMGLMSQLGAGVADVLAPGTGDLVSLGSQVGVLLPYSRAHESEADIIGQELMAKAGFDPRESVTLWQLMAKQGGSKPPAWLSTHPANSARMQALNKQLASSMPLYQQALTAGKRPRCQ